MQSEVTLATGPIAIDARISEIDKALAKDFPDHAALAAPEPLSIPSVQAQLGADEALVLFLDTPEWKATLGARQPRICPHVPARARRVHSRV
jgi:hypothetical protein